MHTTGKTRPTILLILLLMLFSAGRTATAAPNLDVEQLSCRQGGFFVATVSDVPTTPSLWFNGTAYTMFPQENGSYRALVPVEALLKPGSYAIMARHGDWQEKIPVRVIEDPRPVQEVWLDKKTSGLRATREEKMLVKEALQTVSSGKLWNGRFSRPAKGRISSPFGVKRSYNGAPVSSYHKGIDIAAPLDTPVYSPAAGKVILTGYAEDLFHIHGNSVILDHGQGLLSVYLHLNSITVKPDDIVAKGDIIGHMGSTGISTGSHLHWGTYLYGTSVNPLLFEERAY